MGTDERKMLLRIVNKAWQEKDISKDLEVSIILPIFKTGDS